MRLEQALAVYHPGVSLNSQELFKTGVAMETADRAGKLSLSYVCEELISTRS